MSYVVALPEVMSAAATDVVSIGSVVATANQGVAGATTRVLAAAEDEVSAAIAALFSDHGQGYQALSAQAAAFHERFVQALTSAGGAYAAAEAANALPLALEHLPGLPGEFARALGNGFAFVQQEIQQIPTTLATGIAQVANTLVTEIFGSPPGPSIPATQGGTFTGTPSLATKIETAGLLGVRNVTGLFGIDLDSEILLAVNNPFLSPLLSPFIGNTPPTLLTFLLGETVQHTTYDGMAVVQITPANPSGHYVVAIHGGGFVLPPTILHWFDYTLMAHQTGATIEVPIYPLVQQGGTAAIVVPKMAGFISTQIAQHGAPNVSVFGDSAGGTLALSAVEYMVSQGQPVPGSMVLLSPWLAPGLTNPNVAFINDPILNNAGLQQVGKQWAGNLPVTNPLVSPLYGSLSGLPPTYVYSGSLDSLAPDALVLQQEAAAQLAPISFVLRTGEFHDWVLLSPDGFGYLPQIYQELGI